MKQANGWVALQQTERVDRNKWQPKRARHFYACDRTNEYQKRAAKESIKQNIARQKKYSKEMRNS